MKTTAVRGIYARKYALLQKKLFPGEELELTEVSLDQEGKDLETM